MDNIAGMSVIDIVMNIYTVYCTEIVAMMPYHDRAESTTWETCSLWKWLNRDFYDTFTHEEKEYIILSHCDNREVVFDGTIGGNDTGDYVFLLSNKENGALQRHYDIDGYW
ncbi:MAG: hypothetical protein IJ141_05585 [Lachnospiraceae bacterium]|nr:hypothetical protein [Lachnospiraceae bacterium]